MKQGPLFKAQPVQIALGSVHSLVFFFFLSQVAVNMSGVFCEHSDECVVGVVVAAVLQSSPPHAKRDHLCEENTRLSETRESSSNMSSAYKRCFSLQHPQ